MLHLALVGSSEALLGDRTFRKTRGGVTPYVARVLIDEGYDPQTLIRVTCDGTPVFEPTPLEAWAKLTVIEGDNSTKYSPFQLSGVAVQAREPDPAP